MRPINGPSNNDYGLQDYRTGGSDRAYNRGAVGSVCPRLNRLEMKGGTMSDEEIKRLQKELAFQTDMANQADVACLRLKAEIEEALTSRRLWMEKTTVARQQIAALKALVVRAADALAPYEWGLPDGDQIRQLIAELRKAAQ